MRTRITLTVSLIVDSEDDDADLNAMLDDMDYSFDSDTDGIEIRDYEILDYTIHSKR